MELDFPNGLGYGKPSPPKSHFRPDLIGPGCGKVSAAGSAEVRGEGHVRGLERRGNRGIIVRCGRAGEVPRVPGPVVVLAINENVADIGDGNARVEKYGARLGLAGWRSETLVRCKCRHS